MPDKDDETQNLSGTQPITPRSVAPVTGHVQPPAQKYNRRSRRRSNANSGLYLPAWSVGAMLLLVFGITASIVMLVITLGGGKPSQEQPRVVIITAAPSNTPAATPETPVAITSLPTQQSFQGAVPTFALEGPTLPPIFLSPTPATINIGETVIVNTDNLRIRPEPSLNNTELFFAKLGDRFTVIDGPRQGSGLTWWQVQDTVDPTRKGWAAADYLDVAIQ